jgi:hypothetical protein
MHLRIVQCGSDVWSELLTVVRLWLPWLPAAVLRRQRPLRSASMRSAVAGCVAKNPPVRAFGLREPRKRVQHRLRRVSRPLENVHAMEIRERTPRLRLYARG